MSSEELNEEYINEEYVPIPEWHMEILKERLARYESEGTTWTPWEEVERELLGEISKSLTSKVLKD